MEIFYVLFFKDYSMMPKILKYFIYIAIFGSNGYPMKIRHKIFYKNIKNHIK